MQEVGHRLRDPGCGLRVASCELRARVTSYELVSGHWSLVSGSWSLAAGAGSIWYSMLDTRWWTEKSESTELHYQESRIEYPVSRRDSNYWRWNFTPEANCI